VHPLAEVMHTLRPDLPEVICTLRALTEVICTLRSFLAGSPALSPPAGAARPAQGQEDVEEQLMDLQHLIDVQRGNLHKHRLDDEPEDHEHEHQNEDKLRRPIFTNPGWKVNRGTMTVSTKSRTKFWKLAAGSSRTKFWEIAASPRTRTKMIKRTRGPTAPRIWPALPGVGRRQGGGA